MATFIVEPAKPLLEEPITLIDNHVHDGNKKFFLRVKGECGVDVWVEICIWDDEWGTLYCWMH